MFLNTNILTAKNCYPQSPSEYINNVLIPETAMKLISENFGGIPLDEANKVMNDSIEFRLYVHDIDSIDN